MHPDLEPTWHIVRNAAHEASIYGVSADRIVPAMRLRDVVDDSMGDVEFILAIEAKTGRKIPDAEASRILISMDNTLADVTARLHNFLQL